LKVYLSDILTTFFPQLLSKITTGVC